MTYAYYPARAGEWIKRQPRPFQKEVQKIANALWDQTTENTVRSEKIKQMHDLLARRDITVAGRPNGKTFVDCLSVISRELKAVGL